MYTHSQASNTIDLIASEVHSIFNTLLPLYLTIPKYIPLSNVQLISNFVYRVLE